MFCTIGSAGTSATNNTQAPSCSRQLRSPPLRTRRTVRPTPIYCETQMVGLKEGLKVDCWKVASLTYSSSESETDRSGRPNRSWERSFHGRSPEGPLESTWQGARNHWEFC